MGIQLRNNASGTLATAINASDTGIVLTTGNGANFPVLGLGDYFYATLESTGGTFEVIRVTARSGDSMTVLRAQEGSIANSFAAGSRLESRITAQAVIDTATQYAGDADQNLRNDLAAATGSSLVGFQQAGGSAVLRTTQAKLRETVSVKDFGAVGDGVADDTAAIQAALDSNGDVYFPEGTYIVDGLTTTIKNHIFGVATLKLKPNATSDYVLKVTQDQSIVENITIDGNRSGHSSYSGRGEGLIISGSNCRVDNVTSSNTPIGLNADTFTVLSGANNNVISNCISENAGHAGLRNRGDYTVVENFKATQWESKGIVCSNAAYLFIVDGAELSSTVSNSAMSNLLVDPDVTGNVENFVCRNVYASGPNNTTAGNCTKIAYVTNAVYEDCTFASTAPVNNLTGIRVQNNNSSLRLINCQFSSLIEMDVVTDELIIDGCTIGDSSGPQILRGIEDIGTSRVVIKDSNFNRATSSYIRLELPGQYCSVDNCTFTGDSTTTNTVNVFAPDHTFNPGFIYFGENNKRVNMATSLTGVSSRDVQVGLGNGAIRNNFRATAIPTVGDWLQGDVVYNSAPSAGGTVGWVCVTSGTPGTWKTFGTIAA
jgi:hypothetical protein